MAKLLFVENHDSFSYNIIDCFRVLGCHVDVVDHAQEPNLTDVSHVVLGPGPGEPTKSARLMDWLKTAVDEDKSILGVCLGHQAIGLYFGAIIQLAHRAIHGEVHPVYHDGESLFSGLKSPLMSTRYHSLCLGEVKSPLRVHAWSESGEVMGIAHEHKPIFGVQYHPESFLSEQGLELFRNFVR